MRETQLQQRGVTARSHLQGVSLRDWQQVTNHIVSCVCGEQFYSQRSESTQIMHEVMSIHDLGPTTLFIK